MFIDSKTFFKDPYEKAEKNFTVQLTGNNLTS